MQIEVHDLHRKQIVTKTLYPYHLQTLKRIEKHERSTVLYAPDMDLDSVLIAKATRDIEQGKTVLYIPEVPDAVVNNVDLRIEAVHVNLPGSKIIKHNQLIGKDEQGMMCLHHITSLQRHHHEKYDTIIIAGASFHCNHYLERALKVLTEFNGTLIVSGTGTTPIRGVFYRICCHDHRYHHIVARRFIHPEFTREWYQQTLLELGVEKYRRHYELRWLPTGMK